VRALAADLLHPGTIYLGTTDGDIFGSTDAGERWVRLGRAGDDRTAVVSALAVDSKISSKIYATTWTRANGSEGGGVYVSQDAGRTWHEKGLAGHALRALAQAPSDPNVLVAGGLDGVFLSRDSGATWRRISPEGDAELRNIDSLAFDPTNPDVIYAGTFHLPWNTTDGGEHWNAIHEGMIDDSDVLSLVADAGTPGRIFASSCSGIYRSDSGGEHWRKIAGIPYSSRRTLVLRQDPRQPADLYAGTTEGLWISRDGGDSWRRTTAPDWVINAIAIVPEREGARGDQRAHSRIIIGTEQQGILTSDDAGARLRRSNQGFLHQRVVSVATAPAPAETVAILMADTDRPAQWSADGGATWKFMGNNADDMGLAQIVAAPDGWLATLAGGGLARFVRGDNEWIRIGRMSGVNYRNSSAEGVIANALPETREFDGKIRELAFSEKAWYAATDDGVYSSGDAGATWTRIFFGASDLPVRSVQTSLDGEKIRIVCSRGMVFSDDAGKSWTWHDLPFGSGGALRLIWSGEDLFAFSPSGMYLSRDSGDTWHKLEHGLPGALANDARITPEMWVVAMQAGGLYVSRDDGASWSRAGGSEMNRTSQIGAFSALAGNGIGGVIYAGSFNDGLFRVDFTSHSSQ
jgi:photosystem II stability/assembly factor-like uncharacterized protein